MNAPIAISIYKYLISSPENSVASLSILFLLPQLVYFYIFARRHYQRPFHLLRQRAITAQSLSEGFAYALDGFAYLFAPASILVTANRSFAVIFAFLFGHKVFHEKKFFLKGCVAAVILVGIFLLPR